MTWREPTFDEVAVVQQLRADGHMPTSAPRCPDGYSPCSMRRRFAGWVGGGLHLLEEDQELREDGGIYKWLRSQHHAGGFELCLSRLIDHVEFRLGRPLQGQEVAWVVLAAADHLWDQLGNRDRQVSRLRYELDRKPEPGRRSIPLAVKRAVFARDGHRCLSCESTEKLSIDHVIPWSLGGSDNEDNLQTLCVSCNASKGNRSTTDYRKVAR